MAETLGEAVLYLRTDDSAFAAGATAAEGKAVKLGGALDRTSSSSGGLSSALKTTGGAAQTAARELTATSKAAAAYNNAAKHAIGVTNAQRAGLQNLGRQIGDISTMYALGARPTLIFASQIGQVADAAQMALGGGSRLAAFLTGGWGIALMVAVQALAPFIGKLFDTADAAQEMGKRLEEAADGADAFGDAQSILGKLVDLTTGKLKSQNEVLRASIRLQAMLAQEQGRKQAASATEALQRDSSRAEGAFGLTTPGGTAVGRAPGEHFVTPAAKTLIDALIASDGKGVGTVLQGLESLNKAGALPQDVYKDLRFQAVEFAQAQDKVAASQTILDYLDGKGLDPRLQQPTTTRARKTRTPKDRSAQIAEAQAREIEQLGEEETRARLALTDNIDERAALQMDLLGQERDARMREIAQDKDLSEAQKKARLAYIERLYGKPGAQIGPNGEIIVGSDTGLYGQKIMREFREREARLANDALGRQIDALDAQASIADNLHARDALDRKALELQQQIQRNLLEQQIANGEVADADKARAALAKKQSAQRERLSRSQEGPLAAYARALGASGDNLDYAIESYVVDELQSVRDSLHDGIREITGTDDPLINGLIQMFLEQAFIRPWAEQLAQMSRGGGSIGSGGGLFGSIIGAVGGLLGGGGGGGGGGVLGSGFDIGGVDTGISFGGFRAGGGETRPGNVYAMNERSTAPGLFLPLLPGIIQPPSTDYVTPAIASDRDRATLHLSIEVNGARGNAEIREMVAAGVQQGIAGYDQIAPDRVQDHLRRFG